MDNDFVILPFKDTFGNVFKIYSSDLKTYYGDFYSEREVFLKLTALRRLKMEEVCL